MDLTNIKETAITWIKENKVTALAFAVAGIGILAYVLTRPAQKKLTGASGLNGPKRRKKQEKISLAQLE